MIRLDTTTRKLQAFLSGAITTDQLPITVCWSDKTSTTYTGGTTVTNTNSAAAVDICAAPGASTVRDIDTINIVNIDTAAATVTVRYNDNATLYILFKAVLAVGDQLTYVHGQGWAVLSSSGAVKTSAGGDALTANPLSQFAATTSAQLAGVISNETGSGSLVFATSPTLVTPILGTPTSGTLTNCTGLPAAGVVGTALVASAIGTTVQAYDADLTTWAGVTPGTGVATALAVNVGSAGAPVVNGGALGTPSSGTLTNCTFPTLNQNTSGTAAGLSATLAIASGGTSQTTKTAAYDALSPNSTQGDITYHNGTNNVRLPKGTGLQALRMNAGATAPEWATPAGGGDALTANPLSQFAATTSAQLAGVMSDETGSGALVFATSPTLVTPILGTPTSGVLTNCTGTAAGLTAGTVTTNANLTGHITSVGNAAVLGSFTSAQLAGALTDETGSGSAVFATSPTLVTPVLGVAAATSVNKVAITAPATGATLTISDGKTLAATNTITLSGTDSTVMTFPTTSATLARTDAANTFTGDQSVTGDLILTGAGKGVVFEGTTADAFETTLVAGEPTADITITMPVAASTTLAGLAVAETFTAPQRGTLTTDNDGSFDQNITNNFKCTPTGAFALTFTNHTSGQAGNIILVNTGGHAVTAAATTKIATATLTAISTAGTYLLGYVDDGTNAYVSASGALV